MLADEICPDTCRFWDKETGEKLDKDRFRRDMGGVEDAYAEILRRVRDHPKGRRGLRPHATDHGLAGKASDEAEG